MVKKIKLTQEQYALVDDEDFEYLNQFKWHAHWFKNTSSYYAERTIQKNNRTRTILMSRVIKKPSKGLQVHHKNHDTLDNRRCNLEIVTNRKNNQHRKNHGLWPVGIYWHNQSKKFHSRIYINGKRKSLGYFIDFLSGHIIYKIVSEELDKLN